VIDVIIPSVAGREDSLERCIDSYKANTAPDVLSFIVIKDEETVGIAWGRGMELSSADYVHLSCDDLEIRSPDWAGACCESVDEGFLPCPIVYRPNGSIESCGGDVRVGAHLISDEQPDKTPCDFTVVPFLSREQADAIGMIDAHYKSDVYVSHKGRELGYGTHVRIPYAFTHHHSMVKRRGSTPDDDRHYAEGMARGRAA
jgi:hypothetical protein